MEEDELREYIRRNGKARSTGVLYMLCPFHIEKGPSFVYRPRSRNFDCYGCGMHGQLLEDPFPNRDPRQIELFRIPT